MDNFAAGSLQNPILQRLAELSALQRAANLHPVTKRLSSCQRLFLNGTHDYSGKVKAITLAKPNARARKVAQKWLRKTFRVSVTIRAAISHVVHSLRLATGANDGGRTHDLPITNRLLYL
jgi:hypothetical protein